MSRRVFAATLILTGQLLSGCGGGLEIDTEIRSVNYECADGTRLQVKYGIPESGPSMAVVTYANKLIPMHQEPSASGALFVADKGHPGYRWHTKGKFGILLLQQNGEGSSEIILQDCESIPPNKTAAPQP
ncbi:hypothetical protein Maes01_02408 [Microbulbifer aestuariivivens]|uniref:C-type lysozyme inhibitor domain-containing protein n=1 Tax=Microbulbifer aestuariivivens TaxID=1908308 RepID=A0ABP9WUN0_9GAMM